MFFFSPESCEMICMAGVKGRMINCGRHHTNGGMRRRESWACVNSSGGILDADETTSQGYSYITGVAVDCPESPVLMPHGAPGGLCLSRLCMGSGLEGR
ncbi:hypothetical protein HZ326_18475 [Fusarium oxysporum f. sp. albedinis]|nr:hypothetical protein HZ326_18475 [Fusarium oxysporum f. sp. albedinis]